MTQTEWSQGFRGGSPWPEMDSCEVRKIIDDAVAPIIGVDTTTIMDWRKLVATEPTVSNKRDSIKPQDCI